ncbi:MAG: hypothetical protein IKF38_02020 [Clostridia bacterium]|nr:hypothetical protein [Clostridia bacterium]
MAKFIQLKQAKSTYENSVHDVYVNVDDISRMEYVYAHCATKLWLKSKPDTPLYVDTTPETILQTINKSDN